MLEINFEEAGYSITEGSPLNVLIQFRPTQSPFTLTVRPVPIASADGSDLEDYINCTCIAEASRATAGRICLHG